MTDRTGNGSDIFVVFAIEKSRLNENLTSFAIFFSPVLPEIILRSTPRPGVGRRRIVNLDGGSALIHLPIGVHGFALRDSDPTASFSATPTIRNCLPISGQTKGSARYVRNRNNGYCGALTIV